MKKKRDLINICIFYGSALCLLSIVAAFTVYDEALKLIEGKKDNDGE